MCSQSTFVREILLRRLSGNAMNSSPSVPAEEKEAVQSMVRRRVIGLDRSCMVSVFEDQKKSSCLSIYASERCKILNPEELKLKKTLKEFQAKKLEEINAKACRIEEQNAQYEQKVIKMKKKLLEENQARLLKKKQKFEQNARQSAMKYEEWLRKRTKNIKNPTGKKMSNSLEREISNVHSSIDASEQMVCSNSLKICTLPSPNECESSVCTAVPLNHCSSIKLNGIESASKYENELSQANTFTDMEQNLVKSTCPQNICVADGSSADALLGYQTPVPKISKNSSGNVTFDTISEESQHQPPAASSSADDGPSEFFESEEVDCSSRRVDDLLEENDAFARLLDMVDGFPANKDGASALRALCTLDQGTIASMLSNKTLHWTPGGKMILRIFKQQDEPLIPTPVKHAYETHADDGERMCCDAPAHGQAAVWAESESRAPVGTKTSSVITSHEGSANCMNTIFSTDLYADTSVRDHSEERVNHLITENLVGDDPYSHMRESNEEHPVLPRAQTEMLDLEGCHETNLNENTRLCTKISSNYDMSDQISLGNMFFPSSSSCSNFLERQCTKSPMEEFSLCSNIATTSGYSSIPHTSCAIYNCSDVTTDVNSAVIAANSAASFETSISPAKNYLYHQPVTQSSIENRVDSLETMQHVQRRFMIETPNKSFDMGMNGVRGVSVGFKTKASLETPSFREFVSHAQKYNLAAVHSDGTRICIDNAHDGFHSSTVQNYSFPRHMSSVDVANQQALKLKYCYERAEKVNSKSPYHGKVKRTSGTMHNKSSLGAESTSPVAYEECESPEPQDTCQSNQLTQEEFEAINGDGSGPIMMQILP